MKIAIEFASKLFSRVINNSTTLYDWEVEVECTEEPVAGSLWDGDKFIPPFTPTVEPEKKVEDKTVSPVEFKLLFTAQERVAIKSSTNPIVQDFFEIVNDPRLTMVNLSLKSTQDAVGYLALNDLIEEERIAEILSGNIM